MATDDPDALLHLGPYGDLVGTDVDAAAEGPTVDFAITTYSRRTFTVAEGATDLPAYVEGIWAEDPVLSPPIEMLLRQD